MKRSSTKRYNSLTVVLIKLSKNENFNYKVLMSFRGKFPSPLTPVRKNVYYLPVDPL